MIRAMIWVLFLILLPLSGAFGAPKVALKTYAEGFVQFYPDDKDRWQLDQGAEWNPKSFFELQLDAMLNKEFQFWMKASAQSASSDRNEPLRFAFYDMHLRYRQEFGNGGMEAISFMREDSYFWLDQPLLRFTDNNGAWGIGDDKGDKGELNGLYFNCWNILGLNMIKGFVVASGMFDDITGKNYHDKVLSGALRLRKDLLKGSLKIGATGVYWKMRSKPFYVVGAADVSATINTFQFTMEAGTFHTDSTNIWKGDDHPIQLTYKADLRASFNLGSFGQAGFLLSSYYTATNFQNWRGNGTDGATQNRMQETLEIWYNFPLKAISLKESLVYYHPLYYINSSGNWVEFPSDSAHLWNYDYTGGLNSTGFSSYTELYVEFINGFRFKSYYKRTHGGEYHNDGMKGKWSTFFFQLEVENSFAKIKPQILLLNINSEKDATSAFGSEVLINITDTIKFYSRFAMVNGSKSTLYRSDEGKRSWATFFGEIQLLKFFSNTDIFLSFGNGDHTNDDIVHDKNGGILNGRELEKKFSVSIKYWL